MKPSGWARAVSISCVIVASAAPGSSRADPYPWAPGSQWLSLRAGYAKSWVKDSGDGGAGYGFGYSRMLSPMKLYKWTLFKRFALGAYVHHDVTGRFGGAAEIEVPATLELVRHFGGRATTMHPYLGLGAGAYYRKLYRTGADGRDVKPGVYVTLGANTPVSDRGLLGFDLRLSRVQAVNDPINPVFGIGSGKLKADPSSPGQFIVERNDGFHWGAKVSYSLAY